MIKIFIIWVNISLNKYFFFFKYATSTFSGSTLGPVYDENYPLLNKKKTEINVEDSILTTLR